MSASTAVIALPIRHETPFHNRVIQRACKLYNCPNGQLQKPLISASQQVGLYYTGLRGTQMRGMKQQQREAFIADQFCRFTAAGTLKFFVEVAGLEFPRGMSVKTLGKNTMQAEGEAYFNTTENKAHVKFQDTRRQCKIITSIWEKVKPKDKIPSGKQEWDYIIDLFGALWEHEQDLADDKHKSTQLIRLNKLLADTKATMEAWHKKDDDVGGLGFKQAATEWAEATAAVKRGPKTRTRLSQPENWMPTTFLTWAYFGPLSKDADPVLCLQASGCGVKKVEIWETEGAGPAQGADSKDGLKGGLGSASAIQRLNYDGGLSRRQLAKQKRDAIKEEKEKGRKEEGSQLVSIMQEGGNQMGQLVGVMQQLVPQKAAAPAAATAAAAAEQVGAAAALLKQLEVMATEDNKGGLAEHLRKKRYQTLFMGVNAISTNLGGRESVLDLDKGAVEDVIIEEPMEGKQDTGAGAGEDNGAGEDDGAGEGNEDDHSDLDLTVSSADEDDGGVAGGEDGGVKPVLCSGHGRVATLRPITKQGPTQGKNFYMCSLSDRTQQCDFFEWAKESTILPPRAAGVGDIDVTGGSPSPAVWSPDQGAERTMTEPWRQPLDAVAVSAPVAGAPVAGAPVAGAPMIGAPVIGAVGNSSNTPDPSLGWSPDFGAAHTVVRDPATVAGNRQPLGQRSLNDTLSSAAHLSGVTRKRDEAEGATPLTPAPGYRTPDFAARMPGFSGGGSMPSFSGQGHSQIVLDAMRSALEKAGLPEEEISI